LVVGVASLIGSLLPLVPFLFLPVALALPWGIAISVLSLFGLGAYRAHMTVGGMLRTGLQTAALGLLGAIIGYLVGAQFQSAVKRSI
jgi:predicted membrane protein (TIGR00267 family)